MKINGTNTELKRLVRATNDTLESLVKDGESYGMVFGMSIVGKDLTNSEVKGMLSAIEKSLNAYAATLPISAQIDIQHTSGFDSQLLQGVQSAYETSKKIEDAASSAPELKAVKG